MRLKYINPYKVLTQFENADSMKNKQIKKLQTNESDYILRLNQRQKLGLEFKLSKKDIYDF